MVDDWKRCAVRAPPWSARGGRATPRRGGPRGPRHHAPETVELTSPSLAYAGRASRADSPPGAVRARRPRLAPSRHANAEAVTLEIVSPRPPGSAATRGGGCEWQTFLRSPIGVRGRWSIAAAHRPITETGSTHPWMRSLAYRNKMSPRGGRRPPPRPAQRSGEIIDVVDAAGLERMNQAASGREARRELGLAAHPRRGRAAASPCGARGPVERRLAAQPRRRAVPEEAGLAAVRPWTAPRRRHRQRVAPTPPCTRHMPPGHLRVLGRPSRDLLGRLPPPTAMCEVLHATARLRSRSLPGRPPTSLVASVTSPRAGTRPGGPRRGDPGGHRGGGQRRAQPCNASSTPTCGPARFRRTGADAGRATKRPAGRRRPPAAGAQALARAGGARPTASYVQKAPDDARRNAVEPTSHEPPGAVDMFLAHAPHRDRSGPNERRWPGRRRPAPRTTQRTPVPVLPPPSSPTEVRHARKHGEQR
jgi:hypothetical protein